MSTDGGGSASARSDCTDRLEPAPVLWVPNVERVACAQCSGSFHLLRRKHHCRCCGEIFCSTCCPAVPPPGKRTCTTCHGTERLRRTRVSTVWRRAAGQTVVAGGGQPGMTNPYGMNNNNNTNNNNNNANANVNVTDDCVSEDTFSISSVGSCDTEAGLAGGHSHKELVFLQRWMWRENMIFEQEARHEDERRALEDARNVHSADVRRLRIMLEDAQEARAALEREHALAVTATSKQEAAVAAQAKAEKERDDAFSSQATASEERREAVAALTLQQDEAAVGLARAEKERDDACASQAVASEERREAVAALALQQDEAVAVAEELGRRVAALEREALDLAAEAASCCQALEREREARNSAEKALAASQELSQALAQKKATDRQETTEQLMWEGCDKEAKEEGDAAVGGSDSTAVSPSPSSSSFSHDSCSGGPIGVLSPVVVSPASNTSNNNTTSTAADDDVAPPSPEPRATASASSVAVSPIECNSIANTSNNNTISTAADDDAAPPSPEPRATASLSSVAVSPIECNSIATPKAVPHSLFAISDEEEARALRAATPSPAGSHVQDEPSLVELHEAADAMFVEMDLEGKGYVSTEVFRCALPDLSEEEFASTLAHVDMDNSGTISREEFRVWMVEQAAAEDSEDNDEDD